MITLSPDRYLQRFFEITGEMNELTSKKNADYSGDINAFQNFLLADVLGITTVERGILVRMTDKLQRIANLVDKDPQVKSEAIADTLTDLAVYSIILRIYLEEKAKETINN